jgi:hypothetical protein
MHSEREMVDAHYRAWRGCGFCSRAGAVVLPVVCLGACGVLPLCLPWGLMRRAGGRGKFGAHMPETDRFPKFLCARVLGGGVYVPMYPHFSKRYPHLYPHIPPDSGTLRRTFAH